MPIVQMPDGTQVQFPDDMPAERIRGLIASKLEPGWKETFQTAKENMPSPLEYVKSQFSNPIEDVKNVGKTILGGAEHILGFTPEQQISNEQEVASRVGRHYGNYFSERGIKENISQDPTGTLTDILSFGLKPAQIGINTVRKAVTPIPARPGFAEASRTLTEEGIPQTAGQATGNKALKYAESELGGARTADILDRQAEAFTRASSKRMGENAPYLEPDKINAAGNRIGGELNAIGARNNIAPTGQLAQDLGNAVTAYENSVPMAAPGVRQLGIAIAQRGAQGISGQTYTRFRSQLSRLERNTSSPEMKTAYHDFREALDDAMERNAAPQDVEAFRTARQQYRNYLVLRDATATGAENTARGLVTPQKLESAAAKGPNRSWYARGLSDFTDIAKAGRVGMSDMPQSGTGPRIAVRAIPAAAGAIAGAVMGGGAISPEAAIGTAVGAGAPFIAGRALMSRPVQGYLSNQLLPGPVRIPGKAAASTVAISRQAALDHTENVLSKNVLNQVKKFAPQALNAWLSDRSPESARKLAETIATKIKRPDLVDRISNELMGGE